MRETDTGKWILDRRNIQSAYLGGRFLAWPLEDEGRGVSVSVTKPAHLITGASKSSVHPRAVCIKTDPVREPMAKGMKFSLSAVLADPAELSVA